MSKDYEYPNTVYPQMMYPRERMRNIMLAEREKIAQKMQGMFLPELCPLIAFFAADDPCVVDGIMNCHGISSDNEGGDITEEYMLNINHCSSCSEEFRVYCTPMNTHIASLKYTFYDVMKLWPLLYGDMNVATEIAHKLEWRYDPAIIAILGVNIFNRAIKETNCRCSPFIKPIYSGYEPIFNDGNAVTAFDSIISPYYVERPKLAELDKWIPRSITETRKIFQLIYGLPSKTENSP